MTCNALYYGDNLEVMRKHLGDESVDLVYLDPPFNSRRNYNAVFKGSEAQVHAFKDTWAWGPTAQREYDSVIGAGGALAETVSGFKTILGGSGKLAYLCMMAPRLAELKRVLKPTGTIYLQCDSTSGHHLQVLMDSVFGAENFRNQIVWHKRGGIKAVQKAFPEKHDLVLVYSKRDDYTFNVLRGEVEDNALYSRWIEYSKDGRTVLYGDFPKTDKVKLADYTRRFVARNGRPPNADDVFYEFEGAMVDSVWSDIADIYRGQSEKLGYPTQKPLALLERIVAAASNKGDVVLDPFCGCGTAIAAAQKLGRRWIGIDITHVAISVIRTRLVTDGVDPATYEVIGEPKDEAGARALFEQDPHQFQAWACGLAGIHPNLIEGKPKKGADQGIDGRLRYIESDKTEHLILGQVKGGKTGSRDVRDLAGTMRREDAAFGFFVTLEEPTRDMEKEAATVGTYRPAQTLLNRADPYMRLQILTVKRLLAGEKFDYPGVH
jgi:adenine specific DNA methylase Mod